MAGTMNVLLISRGSAASPIFHGGWSGRRDDSLHMVWRRGTSDRPRRSRPSRAPGAEKLSCARLEPAAARGSRRGPGHRCEAAPGRARSSPGLPRRLPFVSVWSHGLGGGWRLRGPGMLGRGQPGRSRRGQCPGHGGARTPRLTHGRPSGRGTRRGKRQNRCSARAARGPALPRRSRRRRPPPRRSSRPR